jgi:peptide-methionine (S)-S-oxide reductase
VICIEYDQNKISYHDLLTVFFASHDSTTVNRQGNDVGTQYRSTIMYVTESQKKESEQCIAEINNSNIHGKPIVTEIVPLDVFYVAENYHHDYYANNSTKTYCELVINPKLEKVQQKFAELLAKN